MTSGEIVAPEASAAANGERLSPDSRSESGTDAPYSPRRTQTLLEQALEEYYRRLKNGEQLEIEAYCARFPACQSALRGLLEFDLFLGDNPSYVRDPKGGAISWPSVGQECGDLTLLRLLGSGTFARVFLASEASTGGRVVAVKFSQGGEAEARTLGKLVHPHIVQILSASRDECTGLTMVRMSYQGNTTLENLLDCILSRPDERRARKAAVILDVLRARARPEDPPAGPVDRCLQKGSFTEGVIHLAAQLAEALAFLHESQICHRDLKPSNVLLDPSGKAILLDFNLSTSERETNVPMGGSLGYTAPEQIRAFLNNRQENLDERADLYALGVIVYRLLNGDYPGGPIPSDLSPPALARFLLERLPLGFQPLRRVCPDLERRVAAALERCLALDPAERPPSAAALAGELKRQFAPARRMRRWLAARPRASLTVFGLLLLSVAVVGYTWSTLPPYSERAYQRGETAYHAGDYDEAEKHFDAALQADPNNPRFRLARGCARLKQSKTLPDQKAKEKLEQAWGDFQPPPDHRADAPTLAVRAYIESRNQNSREAIRRYEEVVKANYRPVSVLNNLAYGYIRRQQFDKARDNLDRAAQLDPNCQAVFYNRAMLAFYEGMKSPRKSTVPPQALEDMQRAIRLGPTTATLYRDAALLYTQTISERLQCVPVSLDTPIVTAFYLRACQQQVDQTFSYLRQAIAEGQPPVSIAKNPYLQRAWQSHAAFADFREMQPQRPSTPMELRLIDPIDLPN